MKSICIFGDSITWGACDEKGGWVERLKVYLAENYECTDVYNLGIPGDTTKGILERFEFEAQQRVDGEEELILMFAIGINDTRLKEISLEKFIGNLNEIIKRAKKLSQKIIFVGLTPVDESVKEVNMDNYLNDNIKSYDGVIRSECKEKNILFIDIFDNFSKLDYKKLLDDGLHPNTKGHEIIFKLARDYLINNKIV